MSAGAMHVSNDISLQYLITYDITSYNPIDYTYQSMQILDNYNIISFSDLCCVLDIITFSVTCIIILNDKQFKNGALLTTSERSFILHIKGKLNQC